MTAVIIIGIVIFIIYLVAKSNKVATPNTNYFNKTQNSEVELRDKMKTYPGKNIEIKVTSANKISKSNYDSSVIDVTDQSYTLSPNDGLKRYNLSVPYWAHTYVYSYDEINNADKEQRAFYSDFKANFINGQCYNLEGNLNYAFILLFDLLDDYENHQDIVKLESQLKVLANSYPKTRSYCISSLTQRMETAGDIVGVVRLASESGYNSQEYSDNYWKLGSRYKTKMELTEEEVKILNHLSFSTNNFCSIEFCLIEILKLYLATIKEFTKKSIEEGTTFETQFTALVDVIARKHFNYRPGSSNYKYSTESIATEIYSNIFKHCENTVRERYSHKRKINTDTYYTSTVKAAFDAAITSKLQEILPGLAPLINIPDENTEIELYNQNTTRWKVKFDNLTSMYDGNAQKFVDNVISLGNLNKKNPSIENIFFEASKFMSKFNKELSLTLYIHYLHHDLNSSNFDNKQFTKTIQKSLFKTNEELHNFEEIVSGLISDKDLNKALAAASNVYAPKRKKVVLDKISIKEVQLKHSGTVELLNEYLQDEFENEGISIRTQEINDDEVRIDIVQNNNTHVGSPYKDGISFLPLQLEVLEFFSKNNLTVMQNDFEYFAKSKGAFKNQLIESINDACYEVLDDILIEEYEDCYTISESYHQKIFKK